MLTGRPEHLSDWHVVFRDGGRLALNERVVPYDLNTPLFSDYAHKLRTMWMPAARAATYSATESFEFPVGTIFSKTFYYPRDRRRRSRGVSYLRSVSGFLRPRT